MNLINLRPLRWTGASIVALVLALAVPSLAAADVFQVNSNGNGAKTAVGAVCEETLGKCTLRAAIEASNADPGSSEILFSGGPFNGKAESAVDLEGQQLQAISTPTVFLGTTCNPGGGAPTPCVRLENPASGHPVLAVSSNEIEVIDLTIVGGSLGIQVTGDKALVSDVLIVGTTTSTATGIEIDGDEGVYQGNTIFEPSPSFAKAIAIRGDSNLLYGNVIENSGLSAIILELGADKNRIGLDTVASENVIENSEQSPIFLQSTLAAESHNEIARNRGSGNGGPFIFLQSPANGGIPRPTITTAHPTTVSGTAEPGAKVRVFATAEGTYQVDGFLEEAIADAGGEWTMSFGAVPVGSYVAATETLAGATSEFSEATAVTAAPIPPPPDNGGGGSGEGGGPGDGGTGGGNGSSAPPAANSSPAPMALKAPAVKITGSPAKSSKTTKATFRFTADVVGARFECKLDRAKWARCTAPKTYKRLKVGKHTFRVRAAASGLTGATAMFKFAVTR